MSKELEIEKLKGSENYHTWCFAVKNVLQFKQLKKCITEPVTETDQQKLDNCKAILALSVDKSLYVHIMKCETALQIWCTLRNLFEDKGLSRKIGLLRNLISTRLDDCSNMQAYVDRIVDNTNKLNGIGFEINDDWMTAILLAGLTESYKPFIMGIEASDAKITSDTIISKLLDSQSNSGSSEAFYSKKKFDKKKHFDRKKCNTCKKRHAGECNKKIAEKGEQSGMAKNAFSAFTSQHKANDWYVDSGASCHMTPNGNVLFNKQNSTIKEILAANNESMQVKSVGKTVLKLNKDEIEVKNVLHVPDLTVSLLSVSKIVENNNTIIFDKKYGCTIKNANNEVIANCKSEHGVYKFSGNIGTCMISREEKSAFLWHRRLGHINYQSLKKMRDGAVSGIEFKDDDTEIKNCDVCARGKQARLPFKQSETKSTRSLELIHSDLCGPMETQSIGHAKYFLTFIDDYTKKVFVYFLKAKSEVLDTFKRFRAFVENQMEAKIKILRTDNGGEYYPNEFIKYCQVNGIKHESSNAHTPQQNGVAERMNRTIVEKGRCLLFDADLPKSFWAEAVNMAVYLINRSICASHGKTPDEMYFNKKVNISDLKLFGCPVMVHINKQNRKKWDSKSVKLIFVGYDSETKGYRCIDRNTRKLTISRDVIFHESIQNPTINVNDDEVGENTPINGTSADGSSINLKEETSINESTSSINDSSINESSDNDQFGTPSSVTDETLVESPVSNHGDPDYVPDESLDDTLPSERQYPSRGPITRRMANAESELQVPTFRFSHFAFLTEPVTTSQAMKSDNAEEWKKAMDEEMDSHRMNETWSLVKLPTGRKPIKAKWVFKLKQNDNGEVVRYKARLVAKGCAQKYGIDYNETFSPVVRYASIRFLMALAVKNGYKVHQMDAITAFLQGELNEEIFMEQPDCYNDGTEKVCKLNRAIYGLKQAGRQWNLKLDAALKKFSLKRCQTDPCIYYSGNLKLIIAIYVDDFLIFYKNGNELMELKSFLHVTFKMKDLGNINKCLGIHIQQKDNCIQMDQSKYIREILERFEMSDCKPVGTPSDTSLKLSVNMVTEDNNLTGKVPFQEAVGSLLHLTQGTRPDIAFAVNDVSRFNSRHSNTHWQAVKRIFRYLKGTIDLKLTYHKNGNSEMHAYSDADWASETDKRRSCSAYVIKMANAAISWCSKRQAIVALSSTEAEYIALSSTVREVMWMRQLAQEVDEKLNGPTLLLCDNQSSIKLAESEAYRPRTKHIDIRYHHTREKIDDGSISIKFCRTQEMTADSLTKPVSKEKTIFCTGEMGLKSTELTKQI